MGRTLTSDGRSIMRTAAQGIKTRLEAMGADNLASKARLLHSQGLGTGAYRLAVIAISLYRQADRHLDADDLANDLGRADLA